MARQGDTRGDVGAAGALLGALRRSDLGGGDATTPVASCVYNAAAVHFRRKIKHLKWLCLACRRWRGSLISCDT